MSRSEAVSPSPQPLPQGLQRELAAADRRAKEAKEAKNNGAVVLDYLDRETISRPDVRAMQKLIGNKQGLPLGNRLYLAKTGFRVGYRGRHHHVRAKDLRCSSAEALKQDIDARLKAFGDAGVKKEAEHIGTGHEDGKALGMKIAGKTFIVVTAPVWVVPYAVVKSIEKLGRR